MPWIGGTEVQNSPYSASQTSAVVGQIHGGFSQDAPQLVINVVVHGAHQLAGIGEALVEIPMVQTAFAAHRPHGQSALALAPEEIDGGLDQQIPTDRTALRSR